MAVREIDHNFAIPEGLKDVKSKALPPSDVPNLRDSEGESEAYSELDVDSVEGDLQPPDNAYIVSQTVRTAPGGRQVVDVIWEVENVPGGQGFNVRVTKEN